MSFFSKFSGSSYIISCLYVSLGVCGMCGGEFGVHAARCKAGPTGEQTEGVQSSKPLENYHWPLDFPSIDYSMASSICFELP